MDLSEPVNDNTEIKSSNTVDETKINGGSTKLMMSETAENADVKPAKKSTIKGKSRDKKPKMFSISEAVMQSIETLKEPEGITVENMLDYIQSRYKVSKQLMKRNVVRFLQTAVQNGILEQASGIGDVERFRIKQTDIAKRGRKQMKNKISPDVKKKKISDADAYQLKKADVGQIEQKKKIKKSDVVEEDGQQSKMKKKVVEKNELKLKAKRVVTKKDNQKLNSKEARKTKNSTQGLKKSDNVKKGKRESKVKKADGKDGKKVKKAAGFKKDELKKKPKKRNSKK